MRLRQCGIGHGQFVMATAPGQAFDSGAVAVARGEIHRAKVRRGPHPRVDKADILEKLGPVQFGYDAHAGDDVAHGDIRRTLPVQGAGDHIVDLRALAM